MGIFNDADKLGKRAKEGLEAKNMEEHMKQAEAAKQKLDEQEREKHKKEQGTI